MTLTLTRPTPAHKSAALAFRQAFFDCGERVINGSELLDRTDDYDTWVRNIAANTRIETVSPDWVLTDTFFALDERGEIVGIIDLRHTLNDFLKDLGHCGYSVRPDMRRRGYATAMLAQILVIARESGMPELLLSVERENLPSARTITKNGGVLLRQFELGGMQISQYRIAL